MPSDRTTAIVIAVVGLLVLMAAAASLADPAAPEGGVGAPSEWFDGSDNGDLAPGGDDDDGSGFSLMAGEVLCFPILFEPEVQLLALALVGAIGLLLWWRGNGLIAAAGVAVMIPMGGVVYMALISACEVDQEDSMGDIAGIGLFDGGDANETVGQVTDTATDPMVILLVLAVVGVLMVSLVLLRDDVSPDDAVMDGTTADDDEADLEALAVAAGDAADRLENAQVDGPSVDNEIYRAWVEMTAHLEVDDPETSTPGEFAQTAIDAGMDPTDVSSLTELFESVRYGDREPTADREARAVEVLRRIETDYGSGEQ